MVDLKKFQQKVQEFQCREQEILSAALTLFLEHGEERVTVEMIAEQVGIGKGTIYKHFQSKSEIYLQLMIRYEEQLSELFATMDAAGDKERLARDYFQFRMKAPEKYALFDRLEEKCLAEKSFPELMERLHTIRKSNRAVLVSIVQARIDEGILESVPPEYHICANWALVHGAVALYRSDFYQELIDEPEHFFQFLMDIAVRMGNKKRSKEGV